MCARSSIMRARLRAVSARDVGLDQLAQKEMNPDERRYEGWPRSNCEDEQIEGRGQVGSGREEAMRRIQWGLSAQ